MTCLHRLASGLLLLAVSLTPAAARSYTGLVVLGDSYSDVGNLLAASTALQAGTGQPVQPAPDRYFDGRLSNGPVYADILALGLGVPNRPSLDGGGDFAFGGALTASNTVEVPPFGTGFYPHDAYPWSLDAETRAFTARAAAHRADPNALYVVFSGLNDVAAIAEQGPGPATTIAGTVAGIVRAVDAIKAAGGRTVLVPNLPDEGKLPLVTALASIDPGIPAAATALTRAYNAALATALDGVTGIRVIRFDSFSLLDDVVADPAHYGFSDAVDACYGGTVTADPGAPVCAQPNRHVFWDDEHPTTAFHTLFGAEMLLTVLLAR